jgi:glycine betaine catabolism B
LPGQYITLSVNIAGKEYKRSYSIASSPTNSGIFEITVKRAPKAGVVSNWLIDRLNIGDTLHIKGPYGNFSCVPQAANKILLLAAGSGVVPIMSMLRWLAHTESRADVILILSFRTIYDIIYHDELNLIAARHPNIKLVITLTQEPVSYGQWQGVTGHVCQEMLAGLVPEVPDRAVYLCGPDSFMADCKHSLQNLNHPIEQLHCESFSVCTPTDKPHLTENFSQVSREQTGNYQIRFAKSGKAIASDGAMCLLELAELSGISIGNECRAGNCGECMVKCLEGDINMTEQAEIDDFDRKKGWIYSCCAYPASDVALDI